MSEETRFTNKPRFCCIGCSAVIALQDEMVSKSFSGREGRGFLLHSAVNVRIGTREDRQLLTGTHTVADVYCISCSARLGWTYLKAFEPTQKYKEGKYLLEQERIFKDNAWELQEASPSS